MTKYAAHPTLYKGIMMRSRLEAKYAAYFDHRGWRWIFEPLDLFGYTPDFLVTIDDVETLVEVKPATKVGQLGPPVARIIRAGWKGPWMVVGADPDICMQGVGRHKAKRRMLGTEAPQAWAMASNLTQWKAPAPVILPVCELCGLQDHLLHKRMCKGIR